MPQFHQSAVVPYKKEQMFALVNDVAAYPQFLPGCAAAQVLEQSSTMMKASILVAKFGVRKMFVTRNTLVPGQRIEMALVEGPFRHLSGGWQFVAQGGARCKIELTLQFEFKNPLIALAFGKIFTELAASMISAFTLRAEQIYGKQ
ncbi:MAG: type II toxin-antitoxin system RatA family toxin [Vibrionaceae bacterium]